MSTNYSILQTDIFDDGDTLSNKAFICTTFDLSSNPTGENPKVLIKNPIGSGKRMKIFKFALTTNVSSNNNSFRFYLNPTVTANGTPLVSNSLNYTASPTISAMQLFSVPTISNNGTILMNFIVGATSTLLVPFEKELIIDEGKQLLINVRPNTTGVTFTVVVFWIEE